MYISARSKVLSTILSIAFISSPFIASALTTSDLNGQIQSIAAQLQTLLQQIQSLSSSGSTQVDTSAFSSTLQSIKSQIQTLGSTSGGSGVSDSGQSSGDTTGSMMPAILHRCGAFTRNLVVGSQGSDVSDLQKILVENNLLDSGSVTGVFGSQTSTALAQFQSKFNVSLPLGTVGPITREYLLRMCSKFSGGDLVGLGNENPRPICTADAKICPDGSAVGRTGPNCSFAACPTTDSSYSAVFTAVPTSGTAPLSVSFSASSLQSSNQVIIEYGDGANSGPLQTVCLSSNGDPANPNKTSCSLPTANAHTYAHSGTYVASLNTYVACLYSNPRCMLAQPAPFATTVVTVTGTPAESIVKIYSISPTSRAVGTTVNISGFGFTSANTILMDGSVVATNVPITSSIAISCTTDPNCVGGIHQGLTFTIPSSLSPNCSTGLACPMVQRLVTPGTYAVTVRNDSGTSNAAQLTVTSAGTTGCTPRPACLDTAPYCQIDVREPAGGWCTTPTNPPVCTTNPLSGSILPLCPSTPPLTACTADAMMCPNGAYVGRSGPNCSFDCSGTGSTPTPAPDVCNCPLSAGSPYTTGSCACGSSGSGSTTGGSGSSTDANMCGAFTHTLAVGSQGPDVTRLQHILVAKGLLASGSATGYFGPLTQNALVQFQSQSSIDPVGVFGPTTRNFVEAHCSQWTAGGLNY